MGMGGGFHLPITHVEIAAWAGLMRIALEPWEVVALRDMDEAALEQMNTRRKPEDAGGVVVSMDDTEGLTAMLNNIAG